MLIVFLKIAQLVVQLGCLFWKLHRYFHYFNFIVNKLIFSDAFHHHTCSHFHFSCYSCIPSFASNCIRCSSVHFSVLSDVFFSFIFFFQPLVSLDIETTINTKCSTQTVFPADTIGVPTWFLKDDTMTHFFELFKLNNVFIFVDWTWALLRNYVF